MALPHPSCVTKGEFCNLSEPWLPRLWEMCTNNAYSIQRREYSVSHHWTIISAHWRQAPGQAHVKL